MKFLKCFKVLLPKSNFSYNLISRSVSSFRFSDQQKPGGVKPNDKKDDFPSKNSKILEQDLTNPGKKINTDKQREPDSQKSQVRQTAENTFQKGREKIDDNASKIREKTEDWILRNRDSSQKHDYPVMNDFKKETHQPSDTIKKNDPIDDIKKARERIDETQTVKPSRDADMAKDKVTESSESFTDKIKQSATDTMSQVKQKVMSMSESGKESIGKVTETLSGEKIKEKLNNFTGKARDKASEIKDSVKDTTGNVVKEGQEKLNSFTGKSQDKASEIKDSVKDKAEKVVNEGREKINSFTGKAQDKASEMKDSAKDKAEDVVKEGQEKLKRGTESFEGEEKNKSQEKESSFAGFTTNLKSMFSSAKEDFKHSDEPVENLIISDHKELRVILDKYESSTSEEAIKWLRQFIFELARHSHAEELIVYPMLEKFLSRGHEFWTVSLESHRKVKVMLKELDNQIKSNPKGDFRELVQKIWGELSSHIEYEEKQVFSEFSRTVSQEERIKAGNQFRRRKLIVPTRPHPSAPDSSPTLEALLGLVMAPADKFKDIFFGEFPPHEEVSKVKSEQKQKH